MAGTGTPRGPYNKTGIVERSARQSQRLRIAFRTDAFQNSDERFRYDIASNDIVVNTRFAHLNTLTATGKKTYATEQAILETGILAYVEMETERQLADRFVGVTTVSLKELADARSQARSFIEGAAYKLAAPQFEAFKRLSVEMADLRRSGAYRFREGGLKLWKMSWNCFPGGRSLPILMRC